MNPSIRLIAVDEDGTFMRPDNTFDQQRFVRLWNRMAELGVRFVVATGNQHHQVRELFGETYSHDIGIVAENGAYVADGDEEVWYGTFDTPTVDLVVRSLREVGAPVMLDGVDRAWVERVDAGEFRDDLAKYFPVNNVVDDFSSVDDRIVMVSTVVPDAECDDIISRLVPRLGSAAAPVPSGDGYFDVLRPNTTKATGVARIAERWGIAQEECACFGNSYNDLEMVEWAGLGVFMDNTPDELIPKADLIAPPYTEDGVLTVMEQLLF